VANCGGHAFDPEFANGMFACGEKRLSAPEMFPAPGPSNLLLSGMACLLAVMACAPN